MNQIQRLCGRPTTKIIYIQGGIINTDSCIGIVFHIVCNELYGSTKVATVDIPGDFMQIYQEGTLFVKLTGVMVRLLLRINPRKYENHIIWFRGEEVIYIRLNKAPYRALLGAIMFWKKLTNIILEKMGFEINPYDWCVAKTFVNRKQCTILWHVDNFKTSHEEDSVISNIIAKLKKYLERRNP